jgi:molybdopterin-containing oxidoreductase family membrane subunit
MELFIAWYGANLYERAAFWNRAFGWYGWAYWVMMFATSSRPRSSGSSRCGRNYIVVFVICQFVNTGMWFERFVIIVTVARPGLSPEFVGSLFRELG